jgi:hypothetical protein
MLEKKMVVALFAPSERHPGFSDVLVFLPHPAHRPALSKHEVSYLRKPVATQWLQAAIERLTDGRVRRDTDGWRVVEPGSFKRMLEDAGGMD